MVYETFDSNEAMYTKIKQGGTAYDLTIPSEYMVTKMRKAHLLDRLDKQKIPNMKYIGKNFCINHLMQKMTIQYHISGVL